MNILYISADLGIPVLGRKGASAHVRALATALNRDGNSVVVATPLLNKSPWEEPAAASFRVLPIPPSPAVGVSTASIKAFCGSVGTIDSAAASATQRILYNQELVKELRRRFSSDRPDFIYERASLYSTAGALLAKELDVPLLLELNAPLTLEQHSYRENPLGDLAEQSERWSLGQADAVLVVSTALRDYVASLNVDSARIHVLPNGVDPALFGPRPRDPSIRRRFSIESGPLLGVIGGLRPWHGTDALPALVERLRPRYHDVQLVMVGDGPQRALLKQAFAARGLQDHAIFTGPVPHEEVSGLVAEFDVALVPYEQPAHDFYFSPLKLFESMACGVPVVATAIGQIEEVVRDQETGLLCAPGDLDAMTNACDRLLQDPSLRKRLGQAAAREVRSRYTWQRNAARVIDLARRSIEEREVRR